MRNDSKKIVFMRMLGKILKFMRDHKIAALTIPLVIIVAIGFAVTRGPRDRQTLTLPRGLSWDMSLEQVKAQEEASQSPAYFEAEKSDALIYKAAFLNYPAALGYYFKEDTLVRIQYTSLRKKNSTLEEYSQLCRKEFLQLQQYFEQEYGAAGDTIQTTKYREINWYRAGTQLKLVLDTNKPIWVLEYQEALEPEYTSAEDALNLALQLQGEQS